jgi:hypothetical protein
VAGDRTPDGVQDVLARAHWDADLVRDDLCAYVVEQLGDTQAVLVLDETGFLKRATSRAGCSANTRGPQDVSRIARSGCFSVMPVPLVKP